MIKTLFYMAPDVTVIPAYPATPLLSSEFGDAYIENAQEDDWGTL